MTQTSAEARTLYQGVLDDLDAHVEARDFNAFADRVLLPYRVQSHAEVILVKTRGQLRLAFDDLLRRMASRNILRRARHCTRASFTDATTIVGQHTTWLVGEDNTLIETYKVDNTLRCHKGVWCIAGNAYSGPPDTLPLHMLDAMTRPAPQTD